jgi:hypothetical protein
MDFNLDMAPRDPFTAKSLEFDWVPTSLDLSPFQDDIYIAYTRQNMLRGVQPLTGARASEFHLPSGRLHQDCLVTISTAYFGRRHHQQPIMNLSLQRYGRVLSELNRALAHPEQSKSLMVLFSVTYLTLFEVSRY